MDKKHQEVLFVRETNDHIAVWEGAKLTKEKATEVSGIETIYWLSDFDKVFFDLMTEADTIYFNTNEHYRQAVETQTREDRFIEKCKRRNFLHINVPRAILFYRKFVEVKEPEEIELMQKACNITEKGFRRIIGFYKTRRLGI